MIGFLMLGAIGLTFYIIYYIFFKEHKIDITYVNKQKLIDSATVSKPQHVNDLYLTGDKFHQSVRLGTIIGWCRIRIFKPVLSDKKGKDRIKEEITEEDVFVFKQSPFPFSLIEDPKVLRVHPDQHSDLIGDVHIKGFSTMKLSEYYYVNNDVLDIGKIDYNILQEAKRGMMFLTLSEMKQIMDEAIGINPKHQKEMQGRLMTKIPQAPVSPPSQ